MRRRVVRTIVVVWLLAGLALAGTGVAVTHGTTHPRPHHLGVVITAGEVFVSWREPAGSDPVGAVVRRGSPACPRSATDGVAAGVVLPLHVLDRSVKAGTSYCYAVYLEERSGRLLSLGRTGVVTVPDPRAVPPANATPPAPTPAATRFDTRLATTVAIVAGSALAAALMLLVLVRVTRARMSGDRLGGRAGARGSLVSRNSGALVVPAMIALAWITLLVLLAVQR